MRDSVILAAIGDSDAKSDAVVSAAPSQASVLPRPDLRDLALIGFLLGLFLVGMF